VGVPEPGVTEPTHALGRGQARCAEPAPARIGRARTNHSSHFGTVPPAPLAGLVSFASDSFADALCLADSAGCSRSFRRPQTAETGTDSGAPKTFVSNFRSGDMLKFYEPPPRSKDAAVHFFAAADRDTLVARTLFKPSHHRDNNN